MERSSSLYDTPSWDPSPRMPRLQACVLKPLRETGPTPHHTTQPGCLFCNIKGGQETGGRSLRSAACRLQVSKSLSSAQLSCCSLSLFSFARPIQGTSPGMWTLAAAAVIETRTEASRGPELLRTLHTYSPESAGDTWYSRSLEPCVWPGMGQSQRSGSEMSDKSLGRLGARVQPPIQVCVASPAGGILRPPSWAPRQHLSFPFHT